MCKGVGRDICSLYLVLFRPIKDGTPHVKHRSNAQALFGTPISFARDKHFALLRVSWEFRHTTAETSELSSLVESTQSVPAHERAKRVSLGVAAGWRGGYRMRETGEDEIFNNEKRRQKWKIEKKEKKESSSIVYEGN